MGWKTTNESPEKRRNEKKNKNGVLHYLFNDNHSGYDMRHAVDSSFKRPNAAKAKIHNRKLFSVADRNHTVASKRSKQLKHKTHRMMHTTQHGEMTKTTANK